MRGKKFFKKYIILLFFLLFVAATITVYIDPFFHYHKPNENFNYSLTMQRYINNGIVKHFDYNALITGTSMTENFKNSEYETVFDVQSIKVPLSGARFKELSLLIQQALRYNAELKHVIMSTDTWNFTRDKDEERFDNNPTYLYNESYIDDVYYLFNKEVLLNNVVPILKTRGKASAKSGIDFDTYSNWQKASTFSKETVLSQYQRTNKVDEVIVLTSESKKTVVDSINQNLLSLVKENPEVDFYFFIPPYSILYWDGLSRSGLIDYTIEVEKTVYEMLLPYDNVHYYSFYNCYDIVTNLDNYKDTTHYSEDINSFMMKEFASEKYRITLDNYEDYLNEIKEFYLNYDYDSIFE